MIVTLEGTAEEIAEYMRKISGDKAERFVYAPQIQPSTNPMIDTQITCGKVSDAYVNSGVGPAVTL